MPRRQRGRWGAFEGDRIGRMFALMLLTGLRLVRSADCADQGAYLDDIAEILGHTTTRMVASTGTHYDRPCVDRAT